MNIVRRFWGAKREGRLVAALMRRLCPGAVWSPPSDFWSFAREEEAWTLGRLRQGIAEHEYAGTWTSEQARRMAESYTLMKDRQKRAASVYLPSRHWQENLDESFQDIGRALEARDAEGLASRLRGLLRDRRLGISLEAGMNVASESQLRSYLSALHKMYCYWRYCHPAEPVATIAMPPIGSPAGYYLEGHLLTTASFYNGARSDELRELISGLASPQVAEIGGGFGPTAYFLLKGHPGVRYLDFDLPEILVLAFYYLSSAFPQKKILLYGEGELTDANRASHDIILWPNFEIDQLSADSCDLVINENSFGEMNRTAVEHYLAQVARCCRGFFAHQNHEFSADTHSSDPGLPARDYPIRARDFTLVFRGLDIAHYLYEREIYGRISDIFSYLYERVGRGIPPGGGGR